MTIERSLSGELRRAAFLLVHALVLVLTSPPLLCVEQFHVLRVVDFVPQDGPPAADRTAPVDPRYFALGALM